MIKTNNPKCLLKLCPVAPTLGSEGVELHPGQTEADTAQAPAEARAVFPATFRMCNSIKTSGLDLIMRAINLA